MYMLLNPKVWIAIVLMALLGFTHFVSYRAGKATISAKWEVEKQQYSAKVLKAEQEARAKEQSLLSQRQLAERKYLDEKRKAATAATAAKSDLDRLRHELSSAPAPSCQAASTPAATSRIASGAGLERELLGACATTLTELAQEADRLEAIIVGLQQYVKNVCLAKN